MRTAWLPVLMAVLAGCMHYEGRRQTLRPPDPAEANQVPAGKMWVQDSQTGQYFLVDDPNAPPPPPQAEPAPAPRSRVPLPPSPRALARRVRQSLPNPPGIDAPALPRPEPRRPRIGISAEAWGMEVAGTASGHPDWPSGDADIDRDLDIDTAVAVSLDLSLAFPRGPRFRMGFTALQGEGEYAPAIAFPYGEPIVPSALRMFIYDLAFTPMARGEGWGSLAMEAGFRYVRTSVDIIGSQRFAEGLMIMVGGDLDLALQRHTLFGDVKASVGLGLDSATLQFDTGLRLKASSVFSLRLGYRFVGLVLYDRINEDSERRLSIALGGPTLELGLLF